MLMVRTIWREGNLYYIHVVVFPSILTGSTNFISPNHSSFFRAEFKSKMLTQLLILILRMLYFISHFSYTHRMLVNPINFQRNGT